MAQIIELVSTEDAEHMIQASYANPVYLLKHSVSCPISARGQMQFVTMAEKTALETYAVIVQYARDVSNYLASALNVRHETPQAILIKDGEAVSVASHYGITSRVLLDAAENAQT